MKINHKKYRIHFTNSGSSRLGSLTPSNNIRHYELTNHLDNILTVVNDRIDAATQKPEIENSVAYEPFGRPVSGLSYYKDGANKYKFGFNSQLKDPELGSAMYSAQFWEYDGRLGRRWNLDPKPTIGVSDYAYFLNNPILFNAPFGDVVDGDKSELKRYGKLKDIAHKKQEKYQSKVDEGKSKYQGDLDKWNKVVNEFNTLEKSKVTYFLTRDYTLDDNTGGVTRYNSKTGFIEIAINGFNTNWKGTIAHELKHAFQYKTGNLDV